MSTTYAKKNAPVQNVPNPSASSVLDSSSQSESLQRNAGLANNATQREEAPRPNNTGMPDNLKSGIESLSGFSMDDVRVHYNSSKPATVQALAYTQGTDIHVAPGQEKHLPHEAWHVAQQMAGRVSPTTNINGMPVNDNAGLEHEADIMGEKAVQCKKNGGNSYFKSNLNNSVNIIQCEGGQSKNTIAESKLEEPKLFRNVPAYFETKNDEGCDNSKYYIHHDTYERVAPINTLRAPNQEYHEGPRNFVYFQFNGGNDIGSLMYDIFAGGVCWGTAGAFIPFDEKTKKDLKDLLKKKIDTIPLEQKPILPFNYNSFYNNVKSYMNMKIIDLGTAYKDIAKNIPIKIFITKFPMKGLAPFDWDNEGNFHTGHRIVNVTMKTELPSLSEADKKKYRERKARASAFAEQNYLQDLPDEAKALEISQQLSLTKTKMDAECAEYWKKAVEQARENHGDPKITFQKNVQQHDKLKFFFPPPNEQSDIPAK